MFLAAALNVYARDSGGFQAHLFESGSGHTLPYRLFVPENYDANARYPLVVWLHGVEAVGADNLKQITGRNFNGARVWAGPERQSKFPAFVLAPQCPWGALWATPITRSPTSQLQMVVELLDQLERQYAIDPQRIYAVGQSMGGFGVWSLIENFPDRFAAAVPVSGGGNIFKAPLIAGLPIWAFHSRHDPLVFVFESRSMIAALRRAGGEPRYTEYKTGLHNAWDRAFGEPELASWLFAQRRSLRRVSSAGDQSSWFTRYRDRPLFRAALRIAGRARPGSRRR